MAPLHLPLFVLLLIPLGPILSTASASHSQIPPETTPARHHHHHHHRSPTNPATLHFHPVPSAIPSMHQNNIDTEESKSLLAVVPITDESQASRGEETMAAMGAAAGLVTVMPLQAAPPTPPLVAAADLASRARAQQQEEAEGSASATKAAPPLNDPAASTTSLLPLLNPHTSVAAASPPPQIQAGAAGVVGSDGEHVLDQLERILSSLGYNEMASAAPLLANSPPLARWPGAITVFAAPDIFLQASCPMCSRRHLLLEHIAMGYYPYSELAAAPAVKIPSASIGFCLKSVSERGPFDIHYARIYVDGVEVSHPELYNDGRYVVHGLHGFLRPLLSTCCSGGSHHHPRSSAICKAIDRLHDGGYGFMALAMQANLGVLERMANLTVFALDDQAIFVGGGRDYIYTARFHLVPGHRLTCAELLRLQPGKLLPTLAGKGQSLAVNILGGGSSTDDVRINYIPIKEADVFINSRIAVHGVYMPFPHVHHASAAHCGCASEVVQVKVTTSKPPYRRLRAHSGWRVTATMAAAAAAVGMVAGYCFTTQKERRTPEGTPPKCSSCGYNDEGWVVTCCGVGFCSMCLEDGILKWHFPKNHQKTPYLKWMRREYVACPKKRKGRLVNVGPVEYYGMEMDKGFIMTKGGPREVNEGEHISKIYTRLQDLEELLHLDHVRWEAWPKKIRADYVMR